MKVRHPPSLAGASIHEISWMRRGTIAAIFVVMYAIPAHLCMETIGDPYRQAVAEIATKGNASLAEKHANSTDTHDLLEVLAELALEEQEIANNPDLEATNTTTNQTNSTKERPRPLPSPLLPGAL